MIDKKLIVNDLVTRLQKELKEVEEAAASARELATHSESKQEGKYDTRSIEAGYLAGAQAKRAEEIKLDIQMLEDLDIESKADQLQLGSLGLIRHNKAEKFYFLSSTSGGTIVDVNGQGVLIISVFSPIGDAAIGMKAGESFEVETPREIREYEVLQIY